MNILLHVLINIRLFKILKNLKINQRIIKNVIMISVLSLITLITRAGILREAVIVYFLICSTSKFIYFVQKRKNIDMFFCLFFLLIASSFHGGVIFMGTGYILFLLKKNQNNGLIKITLLIFFLINLYLFKDVFMSKIGDEDIGTIVKRSNISTLKSAGSLY